MEHTRFSWDEFNALFPDKGKSREERLEEYNSFLRVLRQLDRAPLPALSARERADIFRRSWPGQSQRRASVWTWLALWRRPAVTFSLGIVLGCLLMFVCMRDQPTLSPPTSTEPPLTVERIGRRHTYGGKILQEFYPDIENPKMVVEETQGASEPQRVLHGTLDNGEIYVVWNL